jgi:hypothetical protein
VVVHLGRHQQVEPFDSETLDPAAGAVVDIEANRAALGTE